MEWRCGIDSVAHIKTLEEKGKTIAVLGCGFNNIFPKENEGLFKKIIDSGGLIISEYEPEVEATSEKFLERNRIVSGIALGVLVIESAHRSGTSVTARIAKEQGKKVMAIPHGIYEKTGVGNNRLIRNQIAVMVRTTKDIIDEISEVQYIDYKENVELNANVKKVCLNNEYNEVYQFISQVPCTVNEIYKKTNKSISEINNILLMLELEGYIKKVARGYKVEK